MTLKTKSHWVDYAIFGLSVFLVFCLIFDSFLELPVLVAWLGRWHPVLLHFPIVLLLGAILISLTNKNVPYPLLTLACITALITAISGFFLGADVSAKGDLLLWHQWLGAGVALLSALWFWLDKITLGQEMYTKGLQVLLIVLIGFTGHYGGMVTHGEDFLALPSSKKQEKIPENPLIYRHIVNRILENNCISCHNPNKQKGELLMTNLKEILKGGESGNILIPGNPNESEMIMRLHLSTEDEEHMPPEGKRPLDQTEIQILERWIALGASDTLRLDALEMGEPLVALVKELMEPDPMDKWTVLPKVADSTIMNLSSDYLSIKRIASHSDALKINIFLSPEHDPKSITDLHRIANNIVELDLSAMPIGSKEMEMISSCVNLEWLEIDRTPVTDDDVDKLKELTKLSILKIYETNIGDKSISVFKGLQNLKSLYLWKTGITQGSLDELKKIKPNLLINNGIKEGVNAFFVDTDTIQKDIKTE
ncbi:MAG: hypothetical protein KAJ23_14980 [Maribacter sp.]|nr:hypothetical protein [Maribacter sp.]